jgi:hypothetical protein
MSDLPCQAFIVVPPIFSFEIPFMIEWEIDKWTMKQVGEVFNGPVIKQNDHFLPLGYALSYRSHICP